MKTTDPYLSEQFFKHGQKGGKTAAANMTKAQLKRRAKKAAKVRWGDKKKAQ